MRAPVKFAIDTALKETKQRQKSMATQRKTVSVTRGKVAPGNWSAREVAELCGFNPLPVMIDVIMTGKMPAMPIPNPHPENGEGPTIMVAHDVSIEERVKTLRDCMRYLYPTLSATQITGKDGGAIEIATLDVTQLMGDPKLAAAAQALSLAVTQQQMQLPAAPTPAPQEPDEVILDAETEEPS